MFVKMLTSIASLQFSCDAGKVAEFDDATALRLIETEQAEPVEESEIPRKRGRPSKRETDNA